MRIKVKSLSAKTAKQRNKPEKRLQTEAPQLSLPCTDEETRRLVHELEVHQIELEMQNAELRRVQEELEASRNKYAELYDFAPVGYFTFDAAGLIREVNLAGAHLLGIERQLLVNTPFVRFISDANEREFFFSYLENILQGQGLQRCEIRLTGNDGALIHAQLQSVAANDIENKNGYILTSLVDGTVARLAAERISEVLRQQQAILDNIPDIAWLKDRKGRYVAANHPFCSVCGLTAKDLVGKNDYDIYPLARAMKHENDSREVMTTGIRTYFEESAIDQEGNTLHVEKIETPIFNERGEVIGVIGIAHDITHRKEVELRLRQESTHDKLSGLYNRAFFDTEIDRLARSRMFPISIVMADINNLKAVNDTLGHEAGDNLIQLAARIILRAFRAEDIVARIGGDEFGVLLPGVTASVAQEAIKTIVSSPEIISGQLSIAFGTASADSTDQLAEALKLSDERMYQDKSDKKNADNEYREQKTFLLRRSDALNRHRQHLPRAVPAHRQPPTTSPQHP